MRVEIRKLEKRDNRADFSSGDIEIDRFFIKYAGQNQFRHKISTTYIAVDSNSQKILGYATVTVSSVKVAGLSEFDHLPGYPLPVLRIARIGVDREYQSQGIGRELLKKMLYLSKELEALTGCIGVFVDAKDDAIAFYEKYAFEICPVIDGEAGARPIQTMMYLSMKTIQKVLGER